MKPATSLLLHLPCYGHRPVWCLIARQSSSLASLPNLLSELLLSSLSPSQSPSVPMQLSELRKVS